LRPTAAGMSASRPGSASAWCCNSRRDAGAEHGRAGPAGRHRRRARPYQKGKLKWVNPLFGHPPVTPFLQNIRTDTSMNPVYVDFKFSN
jgi:hypothetical protein